jgi:hypothetical protein
MYNSTNMHNSTDKNFFLVAKKRKPLCITVITKKRQVLCDLGRRGSLCSDLSWGWDLGPKTVPWKKAQ